MPNLKLDPKACRDAIKAYAKEHPEHADIVSRYVLRSDKEIAKVKGD